METALFVSDVHLRDVESERARGFVEFLERKASDKSRLYVLGDLFDIWPGTNAFLVRRFRPLLQVFRRLNRRGVRVVYVEGNHDFKLGQFFSDSLGVSTYPDGLVERLGSYDVYMAHGDLGNPAEKGYRALRWLLRNSLFQSTLRLFPDEWIFNLGLGSAQVSRDMQKGRVSEDTIRSIYRASAEKILKQGPDVVLYGHTHLPDDWKFEHGGRAKRYINLGDWVRHFTYLEFDGSNFYTRTHSQDSRV